MPADRFSGAAEFARALAEPAFRHGDGAVAGVATAQGSWNRLSIGFAGFAAVLSLALGWSLLLLRPDPRPIARFEVTFGEDGGLVPGVSGVEFALSPDGSRIVYLGVDTDGGTQLWQRALNDLEPDPIPGTGGARGPVLSPDGLSVAFRVPGEGVKTVSLGGGPSFTVASENGDPAWGSDGMIYFRCGDVTCRVPETGGEPETVTSPNNRCKPKVAQCLASSR